MIQVVVFNTFSDAIVALGGRSILEGLPSPEKLPFLTGAVSTRKVVFLQTADKSKTVFAVGPVIYDLRDTYLHREIVHTCNKLLPGKKCDRQDIRGGGLMDFYFEQNVRPRKRVWTARIYEKSVDYGSISPAIYEHLQYITDALGVPVRYEDLEMRLWPLIS